MKFLLVTIFLLQAAALPQDTDLTVISSQGTGRAGAIDKDGMVYVNARNLAEEFGISFSTSFQEKKIILKGPKSDLVITANNPFYVISDKKGRLLKVLQVPVTTYLYSRDVYIPLMYSEKILEEVLVLDFDFDEEELIVTLNEKDVPEGSGGFYITSITLDEKANGALIRIISSGSVGSYSSSFSDGVLKVILRGVKASPDITGGLRYTGLVKKIVVLSSGTDTELNITLGNEYSASEVIREEEGNNLLVTIHNKLFTGKEQDKNKEKWDFDVVVIDAGHGGKDAGAIGINGAHEKDINLSIALLLGKMIEENMKDVRVEYTRRDDRFVELYKRGKIANEKNGKLFISIHCNSTPSRNSTASGFEVYLLRPGRTSEAIAIAEMENSVIEYEDDPRRYQQLTDENFILVSMAHSAYMQYSEKFAGYLDNHFSSSFGLPSRGVKQAGFYVLVGASMPSVLIEAGFLSNKTDAAYLNSSKGQQKTAELIFNGIKSFKTYYEAIIGVK